MNNKQAMEHNVTPKGASTKIKYSHKLLSGYKSGVISSDLDNIVLTSEDGTVIISERLSNISELKRRENLLQFKSNDTQLYIRFGDGFQYGLAGISRSPSSTSIKRDSMLIESGQKYWFDLLSRHSHVTSDVNPKSRIKYETSFELWLFLITIALIALALIIFAAKFVINLFN